jgi:uncharacterized damage-inducible protein DinB
MNSECPRIAGQLRRAFSGVAWHGPAIRELLATVTAEQALARPLANGHTIWEIVLHIDAWVNAALEGVGGVPLPESIAAEKDWPAPASDAEAWTLATNRMHETAERLAQAIDGFSDARLQETVPGRRYDFYFLFHGVVQHSLFHGGQIAVLKRAVAHPES